MIAQFIPRKGHEFLIKAAPFIIKQVPDVVFLLFGKGPLLKEIGDKIKTSRLEKYIKVVGFRWDLEKILPCLDLIVHPASMEGLGVSLLQASSAGVPIVASAVGGYQRLSGTMKMDCCLKKETQRTLLTKLFVCSKINPLEKKMGLRGKEIVRNHFSIDRMVRQYISLYSNILKG